MNHGDELKGLWCPQPGGSEIKGEEMIALVQKKTQEFDRTIRNRNIREIVASIAVTLFFGFMAIRVQIPLIRVGAGIVAAAGLWIVWYITRFGREAPNPELDNTLAAYKR